MTTELNITSLQKWVVNVEITRPPHNFFDQELISQIADAFESLNGESTCRVIVLSSQGKNFCAGADFSGRYAKDPIDPVTGAIGLYQQAVRLFSCTKPVIARVQGTAAGGGLGLALTADFRVGSPSSRFTANFSSLGFHQGFGISVTLPRVVGEQRALEMLYSSSKLSGAEALKIGLCDRLASSDDLLTEATLKLASEVAQGAPLAVQSIKNTMRGKLGAEVAAVIDRENSQQLFLRTSQDFLEGVLASQERRIPNFIGE